MIRAGALSYVVVVSLFISIILGSLITLSYYYRLHFIKIENQDRLIRNVNSGFNILLENPELERNTLLDLFDEGRDSVLIQTKNWGLYEIGSVTAFNKNKKYSKSALIGYKPDSTSKIALYLSDMNRPLSLAGNTIIKGNCFLPEAGVKRAYIERQNYTNSFLIDGKVLKSKGKLPKLNQIGLNKINDLMININHIQEIDYEPDTIHNPFTSETVYLDLNLIDNVLLSGNIIVYNDNKITISSTAILEGIIVYAPSIEVENGFQGEGQLIAIDEIIIGENCVLSYPSALMVKSDVNSEKCEIDIGNFTTINGDIIMQPKPQKKVHSMLKIAEKSIVHGQVYNNGFTSVKGEIWGSVYTDKFYLRTPSSIYENHLLNAEINYYKRHKGYIGTNVLPNNTSRNLIKWMR